jgi:hypothetical protein
MRQIIHHPGINPVVTRLTHSETVIFQKSFRRVSASPEIS